MCFHSFDNFKTQCHLVAIIAKKCKLHDTPQLNSTLKLVNWIEAVIAILFSNLRRYEDAKPGAG